MKQNQAAQQRQPQLFITTDEILNSILQYLGTRPYMDVAHLIDAIKQSSPYTPPVEKPSEKETEETQDQVKTIPQMEVVEAEEVKETKPKSKGK